MKVEWNDAGFSNCGRFSIHSEHVRGEPRWYWLVVHTVEAKAVFEELDFDGSFDKRTIKTQAQRIADRL